MNIQSSTYEIHDTYHIGIDVHKPFWKIAIRFFGQELRKLSMDPDGEHLRRFVDKHYPGGRYLTVYEAGFTGFSTHRELEHQGFENMVIHAADVPTTDKEKRRKSDKVDCGKLARFLEDYYRDPDPFHQSRINPVYVPAAEAEALRDLFRLRDQIVKDQTRKKNQIGSFLNKWGVRLPPGDELPRWSRRFIEHLRQVELDQPVARMVLDQQLERLESIRRGLLQVNRSLSRECKASDKGPVIKALKAQFCGVGQITATGFCCEIMDIHRFPNGDQFVSYLGFAPDCQSSADHEHVSGLTPRCNGRLRKLLIEAAWVAVRRDEELHQCWRSYIRRMSKQKAIIRIAKKLALRMRKVWLDLEQSEPEQSAAA